MSLTPKFPERNALIVKMREDGLLPHQIAGQLGISRNTVIGVLNRAGKCTPGFHVHITPYNQARGERCGGARLTESDVTWLRDARRGEVAERARQLGISVTYASHVRARRTWAHVA
jgi:hypothetical protein